jgi:hypothetical protein
VNCLDARSQFPAVVDGMIGLSEWVPVEAHVAKCSDCRKLLDHLYRTKSRNEPQWGRVSMRSTDLPDESTDIIEAVTPAHRSSHRALWVSVAAVALVLGVAGGLLAYGSHLNLNLESSLVALLQKVRPEARPPEVAHAPSLSAPPQKVQPEARPPEVASAPPSSAPLQKVRPETRPSEVASTPPSSAPPQKVQPEARPPEVAFAPPPSAPPPEPVPPRSTPPMELAPRTPSPPASAPEPKITGKTKASSARPAVSESPAPSLPSRVSKPPRPAPSNEVAAAKPSSEPATDPGALLEAGKIDVAVQLSVRNRKDAERDLTMLLTRVGGTKFGRGQTSTLMASVPRSSYSEFTRGLSQIGSWQLEAGRSSLPDPVHVAVKLAK